MTPRREAARRSPLFERPLKVSRRRSRRTLRKPSWRARLARHRRRFFERRTTAARCKQCQEYEPTLHRRPTLVWLKPTLYAVGSSLSISRSGTGRELQATLGSISFADK